MATIKSYTTIEQGRKLAEILPLESADMHYCLENRNVATGYEIGIVPFIQAKIFKGKCNIVDVQPAWSLAALLGAIPCSYKVYRHPYDDGLTLSLQISNCMEVAADNEVDACYEMILKLNELNLL